jgi:hypothetical protein
VKVHRSRPDSRYTIVPNELLQDQRLTFTARGILELARKMRPDVAEGRRMVRAAFAEAKALGYMVEERERQGDGTVATIIHVYDTPGHGPDRGTASGTSVATSGHDENPSSDRRTGSGMPVATSANESLPSSHRRAGSGTSLQRTRTKNQNKEGLSADAESVIADDADASSGARSQGIVESAIQAPRSLGPAAAARSILPPVTYTRSSEGSGDEAVRAQMYAETKALSDEAAFAKLGELRAYRRGDAKTYEADAREHYRRERLQPTKGDVARLTIMYGIQHYSGRWPMFVDPTAPVDIEPLLACEHIRNDFAAAAA